MVMKLKEYLDLREPGAELTCWDKDVDSEFYFYAKEPKEVPDKDFPNVDKCMERFAEVLDVKTIYDNGVVVNLYEILEHPDIIQYAKDNFYEEYQYEDDSDLQMLLFDDNVTNISQGYEEFSRMMVECLDLVYSPERNIEAEEKKKPLSSQISAAEAKVTDQPSESISPDKEPSI